MKTTSQHSSLAAKNEAITYENHGYQVIFFIVDPNGEDFRFLNNIETRHDFRWDRWKPFKKHLVPFSIHCFLMKVYQAKGSSTTGNGFYPEARVCGFSDLEEARVVNRAFLNTWSLWNETGDAEKTRRLTMSFLGRLQQYCTVRASARETALNASAVLLDPMTASMLKFAAEAKDFQLDLVEDYPDFFIPVMETIAELSEDYETASAKLFADSADQIEWSN